MGSKIDLSKASILIVDDNTQSSELLLQILMGFRVQFTQVARSAKEARQKMAHSLFDLIIIDAEMPEEDGVELTTGIRTDAEGANFTTPIIVVSSHTAVHKVMEARDAGANIVVRKPISPAALLNRIEWLARTTRPFVISKVYNGPDRRFKAKPLGPDSEERRADALALMAAPDRAMSQDEVDSLFG